MDQEPDRSEAFFQRWFSRKEAADTYADELDDGEGPPPRTELIRRALSLMKVAHQARKEGRFVGIADRASKLDTLIVGLD